MARRRSVGTKGAVNKVTTGALWTLGGLIITAVFGGLITVLLAPFGNMLTSAVSGGTSE